MMAMMANLSQMMAPSMMGMAVGSMVGRMAGRTFGQYDLPIPRSDHALLVVPATIDEFAAEWSLPVDEMRLWVLAQEMIGHTLFSIPPLRDQFTALVRQHVGAFRPDPSAVADKLSSLEIDDADDPMAGDAATALGPGAAPGRRAVGRAGRSMAPQLDAAVAASRRHRSTTWSTRWPLACIGGDALRIAEAVRRRRLETSPDDLFVERLLGPAAHAGAGAARQDVHGRRGRSCRRGRLDRAVRQAHSRCPRRPRSTPPASGSHASSCSDPICGARDRTFGGRPTATVAHSERGVKCIDGS